MLKTKAIKSNSNFIFASFGDCIHLFLASRLLPIPGTVKAIVKNNENSTIPLPNEEQETEWGDGWGCSAPKKMVVKSVSVSPC